MTLPLRAALLLMGTIAGNPALAQEMPDPTRPPFVPRPAAEEAGGAAAPEAAPVLQSILIGKDRRTAIISGRRFEVGDRVGNARIVRITETEVLLRSGEGLTTLKLFPRVLKRAKTSDAGAAPVLQRHKKNAMRGRETVA